jgi:lipoprotein NlpI
MLKKDFAKAAIDSDAAVELDPKNTYYLFYRSVALFLTRRPGASNGFKTVLELEGWRGYSSLYAVTMGHFAARRDGHADQAKALLDEAASRCDTSAWPYPVVKYLRGEIDESKLLAAATDDDRMTEVHCFLGLKSLNENKKSAALSHFLWVKEHGNPSLTQYAISLIELDRLEGK